MELQAISVILYCVVLPISLFILQGSTVPLNCTFDSDYCNWKSNNDDDFDWQRVKGSLFSSAPAADHTNGAGYYIYIDAYYQKNGEKARITSPMQTPGAHCLTLWYNMNWENIGALKIYEKTGSGTESQIFTKYTSIGSRRWQKVIISRKTNVHFQVVLEGVVGRGLLSDISVDDIFMSDGMCTLDCTFEAGLCHWVQDLSDDFEWRRHKGETNTPNTGPQTDNTTGSGYYIYIDTSEAGRGTSARILSPWLKEGKYCFSFWYYMYGEDVETLTVQTTDVNQNKSKIVEITGEQIQQWIQEHALIQVTSGFQIIIEGTVKNNWRNYDYGDIALDDIRMISCQDCADPTPRYGTTNSSSFQYRSTVQVVCNPGYSIKGNHIIFCKAGGIWSDSPTCEAVDCLIPTIANGKMAEPRYYTTYNHTVNIVCEDGYDLVGNNSITCQADGNWSDPPTCDLRNPENNSALTVIYATVPLVVFVFVIAVIAVIWRRRILRYCTSRSSQGHAGNEQPRPKHLFTNMSYSENIYENQSTRDGDISQDGEYTVIADAKDETVQADIPAYSNTVVAALTTVKDVEHTYNHTTESGMLVTDNTYSHLAGDKNMATSDYNTTEFPFSGNMSSLLNTNPMSKTYEVLNTKQTKTSCRLQNEQDPEYDHAQAGRRDPEDTVGCSHLNLRTDKSRALDKMFIQTQKETEKGTNEYKQSGNVTPEYYVLEPQPVDTADDERHYFVLEKEDNN